MVNPCWQQPAVGASSSAFVPPMGPMTPIVIASPGAGHYSSRRWTACGQFPIWTAHLRASEQINPRLGLHGSWPIQIPCG